MVPILSDAGNGGCVAYACFCVPAVVFPSVFPLRATSVCYRCVAFSVFPLCVALFHVSSCSLSVLLVFHVHVPCSVDPFFCPVIFVGGALYNDPVTVCFVVGIVGSMRWDLVTPSVLVLYVFWCFSLVPMTL